MLVLVRILALFTFSLLFRSFCLADKDDETAAISGGVDDIAKTLHAHRNRCSYAELDSEVLDWISRIENDMKFHLNRSSVIQNYTEIIQDKIKQALEQYKTTVPAETTDDCAEPFQRAAGSCLWIHKGPSLSWSDAREFCQQEGADLATPHDVAGVVEFLNEQIGSGWWYVWFGGKQDADGNWKWLESDGEMNVDDGYWDEPEVYPEHVSCASFRGETGFKITQQDCGITNWFLCEKKVH